MSERSAATSIEELLRNAGWARRLAGGLMADADAEDVIQEALGAAVSRPPERRGLRAWFRQVINNQRARRATAERRRRAREAAVASLDEERAAASPEELLGRLQLQRLLAEAVVALEEPYRQTLLLRYYDEQSSAEIARRLGVPAGTVRWRLKQGLALVREALDERIGRDRGVWLALLSLPAARRRFGATAVAAGAVALILSVGALVAWRDDPGHPAGRPSWVDRLRPGDAPGMRAVHPAEPPRPATNTRVALAALALASRPVLPVERLAQANTLRRQSCPEAEQSGLCVTLEQGQGGENACPQRQAAGARLIAVRRGPHHERAIDHWKAVSSDKQLPYELRIQADLALAEINLETFLELPPVTNLDSDQGELQRYLDRVRRDLVAFGEGLRKVTWELERLAGASSDMPETRLARARLGQVFAEAARLKLAMDIPNGLRERNQRGTNQRELFCKQISEQAAHFFSKARGHFRACLETAGAAHPLAVALCTRELERLPP